MSESLYQFLHEFKGYSESEAEETVLRYDAGMEIPSEVLVDIREFFSKAFPERR